MIFLWAWVCAAGPAGTLDNQQNPARATLHVHLDI